MKNLKQVVDHINNNNGVTFNPYYMDECGNIETPKTGYVYSLLGMEEEHSVINENILSDFIKDNCTLLNNTSYYVGVWFENGVYILDISICTSSAKLAVINGMRNIQNAIYHIDTNEVITIPANQHGTFKQKEDYRKIKANQFITNKKFY